MEQKYGTGILKLKKIKSTIKNTMKMSNSDKFKTRLFKKSWTCHCRDYNPPSKVMSGFGYKAPSDKLNIAGVGIGGKGHTNLHGMATENIVALMRCGLEICRSLF